MMLIQRKALYNLIQLNLSHVVGIEKGFSELEEWQIADYRTFSTDELFRQLYSLQIPLTEETFLQEGKSYEAPEEMVEAIAKEKEPLVQDRIFLLLFELWRRFFPEKRTISIFCDELDCQMVASDLGNPNKIEEYLNKLELLLEEQVDQGINPLYALDLMQRHCANDIENFLFVYILGQIEGGKYSYAKDLLDSFRKYCKKGDWFIYLEARHLFADDSKKGYELLEKVIKKIKGKEDFFLVEEILFFLANSGNHSLFYKFAKKVSTFLSTEEEFKLFLEACYLHYDYLELKEPTLRIAHIFRSRSSIANTNRLSKEDDSLKEIQGILDQKLQSSRE